MFADGRGGAALTAAVWPCVRSTNGCSYTPGARDSTGYPGVSGSPRQALAGWDLGPGCHLVNIWEGRKRLSGRDGFLKGPGVGGGFQRDKAGRGSLIA